MDGKIILLLMSVVAVGMFVLPSSLALYTGSHDFVGAEEVDCGKCHSGAAGDQIGATVANGTAHSGFTCKTCHYGNSGAFGSRTVIDFVGNATDASDVDAHAAGVGVNCIDCHSYPLSYQADTKDASGVDSVNVSAELSLATAAHKMLTVNGTAGGLADDDAVCIACHSRVAVSVAGSSLSVHNDSANQGTIYITNGTEVTEWLYTDSQ